jgi:hypothetical protein
MQSWTGFDFQAAKTLVIYLQVTTSFMSPLSIWIALGGDVMPLKYSGYTILTMEVLA